MSYWAEAVMSTNASTTLNGAIKSYLSDLEISDRQSILVSDRQKAVRERATSESTMDVESSFLIGSYPRDTQIRPIKTNEPALDVDGLLVMSLTDWNLKRYWHNNDGGTQAITDLYHALNGYQGVTVKIDRPSVTINWQGMVMELTPAFSAKGGGYLIPSKESGKTKWIHTAPDLDADALTTANKACNNELKPLIKMLKGWNRNFGKELGGFAIETQAFHSAKNGYQGYRFEIKHFFDKLLENDCTFISPPSGMGEDIFIYLSPHYKQVIANSKKLVQLAYEAADRGDHKKAIELMGLVFGKPFPGAI